MDEVIVNIEIKHVEIQDADVELKLSWEDAQFYAYIYQNYPHYFSTGDHSIDRAFRNIFQPILSAVNEVRKEYKVIN